MANTPFPIDPELTGIVIAYKNQDYIADEVFPRVPVGLQDFKYWSYPVEETFAIPDTRVGRRGQPNEIDLTATETSASTKDYGLDDPVPQADIDNAPPNHNPVNRSSMQLMDYIMLGRELRAATLAFTAGNYPSGNKVTLSGTDQWSDYTNSDPIDDISVALDACLIRPNQMVIGQEAWTKLARHPKIMKAVHGNDGDTGIARRQQIAELFELSRGIKVGQSRRNTAKKGQTATLTRVWGKHCALHFIDPNADTRQGITFGLTAQWGSRIAGSEADSKIGLRGGQRVRVGESVEELIVASQAGYLITDAIA